MNQRDAEILWLASPQADGVYVLPLSVRRERAGVRAVDKTQNVFTFYVFFRATKRPSIVAPWPPGNPANNSVRLRAEEIELSYDRDADGVRRIEVIPGTVRRDTFIGAT